MSSPSNRSKYIQDLFPQVSRLYDSGKKLVVEVKESDCVTAKSNEPNDCALARAAKRQLHADGVIVGISSTYIIKGNSATRFKTTPTIAREITSFDRHHDFAPGVYTLSKICPSGILGRAQVERQSKDNRKGDRHKEPRHRTERIRLLYDKKKRRSRRKR